MYFVCASARVCVVNDRLITRPALDPSRESGISQHRTQPLDLSFKAIMVSTMTRFDLLDMHLKSIDSPIRRVFGLLNHAKVVIKQGMLNTISRYEGCGKGVGECSNPNIRYQGYAKICSFCGDDTRFKPGRLEVARQIVESNDEVCVFLFEGYAAQVITYEAIKLVGPCNENFWPEGNS